MANPDYIVIGGGSSGCIVAARLAQDFGASVSLLEAGPAKSPWLLDVPAGYMKYLDSDAYLTMHETTAQPQLGGRSLIIPQARILGGGSAVNAMVYMRGQAADYDAWEAHVGGGWSYADLLPHFAAVESNADFGPPLHGRDGPIAVSHLGYHCSVSETFIEACKALGWRSNPDFNGDRQAGVGYMQHTIDAQRHRRSSVRHFLNRARQKKNLDVQTDARVTQVVFDRHRAVGVRYRRGGEDVELRAGREVILAAGAIMTPTLLMRSGLGPADHLKSCGIEVLQDAPQIGQNLQDHCETPVIGSLPPGLGYYGEDRGWRMLRNGVEYLATGGGRASTTGVEACVFVDSRDNDGRPDLQIYCVPTVYLDRTVTGAAQTWGVTLTACLLRPESRGTVRLDERSRASAPLVDPAYLRAPEDLALAKRAIGISRRILRSEPMGTIVKEEIFPTVEADDDISIEAHVKATIKTNYHPVGTCAMGQVVDDRLRVKGVEGLRIVDASVFPTIPSGNTNAPVMAVAHKAAELIGRLV